MKGIARKGCAVRCQADGANAKIAAVLFLVALFLGAVMLCSLARSGAFDGATVVVGLSFSGGAVAGARALRAARNASAAATAGAVALLGGGCAAVLALPEAQAGGGMVAAAGAGWLVVRGVAQSMVVFARQEQGGPYRTAMGAGLIAAAAVLLLSLAACFGWIDRPLKFVTALFAMALGVSSLCSLRAGDKLPHGRSPRGRSADDPAERVGYTLLLLRKPLAGWLLMALLVALHWSITAMREPWAHGGLPDRMAAIAYGIVAVVLAFDYAIMRLFSDKIHVRTMLAITFYGLGALYVLPLAVGIRGMSVPSMMWAAFVLYGLLLMSFMGRAVRDAGASLQWPALLLVGAGGAGLAGGFALGWVAGGAISGDEVLLIATIIVAVYLTMAAPAFFFKSQSASLSSSSEVRDAYLDNCRALTRRLGLSPRETEVLELAGRGYSAPAISVALYISENTVKAHMKNLYQKLGVHSKQELIALIERAVPRDEC